MQINEAFIVCAVSMKYWAAISAFENPHFQGGDFRFCAKVGDRIEEVFFLSQRRDHKLFNSRQSKREQNRLCDPVVFCFFFQVACA